MNCRFKTALTREWCITDTGIVFKGENYNFSEITRVKLQNSTNSSLINGVINITVRGKDCLLVFPFKQKAEAEEALEIIKNNYANAAADKERAANEQVGLMYHVEGVRGRSLKVYEDRCIINVKASLGSFITGNVTDGEKTIYYSDCVGVQFKEAGTLIGYLQFETASNTMNQNSDNFFNENTFTFDLSKISNEKMKDIRDYVQGQIRNFKSGNRNVQVQALSAADELKKYKDLLDSGIITQEEFDAKKKQLLGL